MRVLKRFFALFLVLTFCTSSLLISTISSFAEEQEILAQYSGSTTASYGYKPYCIFTINKIVGNRFSGTFSAQNRDFFININFVNVKLYFVPVL